MEQKNSLEKTELYARWTYTIIEWIMVGLVGVGFWVRYEAGIVAIIFLLWSEYWYAHGAEKWVIDEYEQGGYPTEGLKTMFKSWGVFAVLAAIVLCFCL